MRAGHLTAALLGCLSFGGQGLAESSRIGFESIFDLPFVDSLEFAPGGQMLFVAMGGHMLNWQLDPLKLQHHQPIDILPHEMAFGADGQLYLVGLALQQSKLSRTISKAVSYTPSDSGTATYEIAESNSNLGISQYSTIAFTSSDSPIVASSSSFTANPFPTRGDFVNGETTIYPQLKLVCGGAAQMSIFNIAGEDYFLTSAAGTAGLEFGKLALGQAKGSSGECFTIQRPRKGVTAKPTFDALRHAVIDIENTAFATREAQKAVVVLDPNTNSLHIFRIEPYGDGHFLSRVGALELSLTDFLPVLDRNAVMTDLSTDARGREIHVSSNAANVVLRFEFDGTGLRSRGRFAMGAPVRRLAMSGNGASAAIVTGRESFGGDWRIVLIANPAALSDWLQIPASFPSIRNLQQNLNESGLTAGFPDGILGPQTTDAVGTYWQKEASTSKPIANPDLETAIVNSFPRFLLGQAQTTAEN